MRPIINILLSFVATISFCIVFNIERKKTMYAGVGGALSWLAYELIVHFQLSPTIAIFGGSLAMGLYSEIFARRLKSPATIFFIPGFVPLVPGSNIYYSVRAAVSGDIELSAQEFITTLVRSGAIALGLIIASSLVVLYYSLRRIKLKTILKEIRKN